MIRRLLIANRGEIAVRIQRTAAEMGVATVAIASEDDRHALHVTQADEARILPASGPAAYLDAAGIIAIAREAGCDAIHPGYGFLSENADFARACATAGLIFVGPTPDQLDQLGDKAAARALAIACDVPVPAGSAAAVSLEEARAFMTDLGGAAMVKALSGGGGRGIRLVSSPADLDAAYERCRSEALRSFGDDRVYVEQAIARARHIEIQVVGDGAGGIVALGERDCTVQRRNQKLIEIAPSPALSRDRVAELSDAAIRMAAAIGYANAGTFEFLVEREHFYFLEANPRLQVEHTVTEELWGVDLVRAQLMIAAGARLADTGLDRARPRPGFALQARINMERLTDAGVPVIAGGTITAYEPVSGPGIRVDGFGHGGYATSTAFDSLLAKLIVSAASDDFAVTLAKARRALTQFRVDGVATNIAFLGAILAHPALASDTLSTRFVDDHLAELLAAAGEGVAVAPAGDAPEGMTAVVSPITGIIVEMLVATGETVAAGQPIAIAEAMKMEHVIAAPTGGTVQEVRVHHGAPVAEGEVIALIAGNGDTAATAREQAIDLDHIRPDLAELLDRAAAVHDEARPEAVARRRARGARTARENIAAVCDPGSFVEYGALVIAAQRARRPVEELKRKTPADGVVVGFGAVNGVAFPQTSQSLLVAFDDSVLAGTVGEMAREKLRRAFAIATDARRPVVLFAEGGGGRAGDTDGRLSVTGWTMDVAMYALLGRMSGLVPLVGVVHGSCFAANAGLLACCDVIIATRAARIGVGGPAMIEGGRLGSFTVDEIGPIAVQTANGVVDILVEDEEEAARTAKAYLAYFQGPLAEYSSADQRGARAVVPESRVRAYDMRAAIAVLADTDSVLELRAAFGVEIITALIRVEGKPLGVIANNPMHLGGAIASDGADKASRFMKLCEAFGLPILMLCDTPGMMVGPEAEKTATVRHMGRMFVTGANLTVPLFTIILRKAYGIGAELMAGGWFKGPRFVVSWPTGELGGMNIEGNVKLGHGAELDTIADPDARRARFEALVAGMYETGRALSAATHFEVDAVIDPADSRRWIASAMAGHNPRLPGSDKRVPFVDPW